MIEQQRSRLGYRGSIIQQFFYEGMDRKHTDVNLTCRVSATLSPFGLKFRVGF
jgi:hypothetical protein